MRLDLSRLLGGKALDMSCSLIVNGFRFRTQGLVDTGANGFLFIHTSLVTLLTKHCGVSVNYFPKPIPVKGFDGKSSASITQWIQLTLEVDSRRLLQLPLLVANIGRHDLILGREWMAYFNIDVGVRSRRLLWPADLPPQRHFDRHIPLTRESMAERRIDYLHQSDANRRDQRMLDLATVTILPRSKLSVTSNTRISEDLEAPEATPPKKPSSDTLPSVYTARTHPEVFTKGFQSQLGYPPLEFLGYLHQNLPDDMRRVYPTIPASSVLCEPRLEQSSSEAVPEEVDESSDAAQTVAIPETEKSKPRWQPTSGKRSHDLQLRENLQTMKKETSPDYEPPLLPPARRLRKGQVEALSETLVIDIAGISAPAFHWNLNRAENEVFSTSLNELDRAIAYKQGIQEETEPD